MNKRFVKLSEEEEEQSQISAIDTNPEMINLNELIKSGERIWVVNDTNEKLGLPMFVILDLGGRRSEPIPPGPEPFCISDRISRKKLEDCDDLFRLLDKGVLRLIPDKDAQNYYRKNPKAKQNLEAKLKSYRAPTEGGAVKGFKDMFGKSVFRQMQSSFVSSDADAIRGRPKSVINPKVQWLVRGLEDGIIDTNRFQDEIRSLPNGLTDADIAYIKTQKKAKTILEKITNG